MIPGGFHILKLASYILFSLPLCIALRQAIILLLIAAAFIIWIVFLFVYLFVC